MKWLVVLLSHRWTPFFALTGGSFVLVLLLAFLIPDRIGADTKALPRVGRAASTLGDGTPPATGRGFERRAAPAGRPGPGPGDTQAPPVEPTAESSPSTDDTN